MIFQATVLGRGACFGEGPVGDVGDRDVMALGGEFERVEAVAAARVEDLQRASG